MEQVTLIAKPLLFASAILLLNALLWALFYKKKAAADTAFLSRAAGIATILMAITILITAYFVHRDTHALGFTLLVGVLLSVFYQLVVIIIVRLFNIEDPYKRHRNAKKRGLINFASMIILSCDCAYAGYALSGGKTSVLRTIVIVLVSVALLTFLSWLLYGKERGDVEKIKTNVAKRMNELNALDYDDDED